MEELNLQDADQWADVLLERVSGTDLLKLNVVAGGEGGDPFDAIQELSIENNIPPENLQLARIQINQEKRFGFAKSICMEFKNLGADDNAPFLRTRLFGNDPRHNYNYGNQYNVLQNRIKCISGSWGSYIGPHYLGNYCIENINITLENGQIIQCGNGNMLETRKFNFCAPEGFYISNFYGQSGWSLDQIGVYLKPDRPLDWSPQTHNQFPDLFQKQVQSFLLCVNRVSRKPICENIIQKIIQKMVLKCGMTVEQYQEMTQNLVFNQRLLLQPEIGSWGTSNNSEMHESIEPDESIDEDFKSPKTCLKFLGNFEWKNIFYEMAKFRWLPFSGNR